MHPQKRHEKHECYTDLSAVLYRNKQGTCVTSSNQQPDFGLYL